MGQNVAALPELIIIRVRFSGVPEGDLVLEVAFVHIGQGVPRRERIW